MKKKGEHSLSSEQQRKVPEAREQDRKKANHLQPVESPYLLLEGLYWHAYTVELALFLSPIRAN